MSKLHLAQIKRFLEEHYIPHCDTAGAEQDHHKLSRAVAAMALNERTALPVSLSAKSVTDHALDHGIDAVAYAADRSTLVLVQSKWSTSGSSGVNAGDVLKFIEGAKALIDNDQSGFGGPILQRWHELRDILSQSGTNVELVIATSSTADLGEPQQSALRKFCNDMNDSTEIASWVYLDQRRLYAQIASERSENVNLNVTLRNWGTYQEGQAVAYYGTASAHEVVSWFQEHGTLLFSRNIRGALRDSEVNAQIADTASQDPSRFWFFNNGITVIAESFGKAPHVNQKSGSFTFRRASVVNGAQTVSSLTHAAENKPSLLETADVFIRFVTLEDPDGEFGRLVTRRTNTQNQAGGREFVALDPEQERIRMEFSVSGYRYAYRSGETISDPLKGCDLSEATAALACAAGLREAVLAKREIGQLWQDIHAAPYLSLFNPGVSGARVWNCVQVMRHVDEDLRNLREAELDGRDWLVSVHSNRVVLWAIFEYLGRGKLATTESFGEVYDRNEVTAATELISRAVVSVVSDNYSDSYPQPLFRNQTKVRDVADKVMKSLPKK